MYFDPGFGSILIQVALAVIAAGAVVWLKLRKRIKTLFSKKKNINDNPEGQDEQQK